MGNALFLGAGMSVMGVAAGTTISGMAAGAERMAGLGVAGFACLCLIVCLWALQRLWVARETDRVKHEALMEGTLAQGIRASQEVVSESRLTQELLVEVKETIVATKGSMDNCRRIQEFLMGQVGKG